jgi:hypothetical protein
MRPGFPHSTLVYHPLEYLMSDQWTQSQSAHAGVSLILITLVPTNRNGYQAAPLPIFHPSFTHITLDSIPSMTCTHIIYAFLPGVFKLNATTPR